MLCKKCGSKFSCHLRINGVSKNLSSRKYCLECSPYGLHNTVKLDSSVDKRKNRRNPVCAKCQKKFAINQKKGSCCWTCLNRAARQKRTDKIKSVVGNSCWICGYDKSWKGIQFHHVIASQKKFNLSECNRHKWPEIEIEMKKCIVVCACCHAEIHDNLVEQKEIEFIWRNKWNAV